MDCSRWDFLEDFIEKGSNDSQNAVNVASDDVFQVNIGKSLLCLHNKDDIHFDGIIAEARKQVRLM